ncbi:putative trans-sialidase, Group VI [Trypanosoma cruzi]|nr:putative trans-sialidase, Group VI [Trypanosoma cruzi]
MLSRVAVVKAPRTHNRRCVTGSSGRRMEGGESEPQRPNMSRHLFGSAVLLVLVMMCCGTGVAHAEPAEQSSQKKFEWKVITEGVTVESLGAPGLLKVGNDVFAVAEAQCKEEGGSNSFTGIASQVLTINNPDKPVEVLNDSNTKTQFLEESISAGNKKVDVSRPTTVVKGNDIYMLVGKYSPTAATDQEDRGAEDCGLLLVKGKAGDESSDSIIWGDTAGVPCVSTVEEEKVGLTRLIGGGGSGVKMHDDTLVFPVEGTKEESGKTVSLLIYSLKDANSWKLSKGIPDGGCSDPSVVEWGEKDKKLIMMTACDGGRRRVYESGDMGDSWTEALGTLSRVWFNKQGEGAKGVRSGFITATIGDDNRNVMLVTLPVYPKETDTGDNEKGKLHLWLTDNTHIVDIGLVSDGDAAASSLLYKSAGSGDKKEEQLIALYEKKKGDGKSSHSLWSVLLTEQLQRVKDVLATWKEVDETVSKLCPSSAEEDASTGAARRDFKVTDGLVGFLSGNFSESTWRDEYLGVNATVKKKEDAGETGATLHEGSVKFTGAWAEWPVGSQGENQLYHFANYNFTLVATVSIHGAPEEGDTHIPLIGVKLNDNEKTVLLGLSYDSEKKWKLLCGSENPKEPSSTSETTHHVVILLRNGNQGSAYVDGKRVGGDVPCELKSEKDKKFSHFYIGGDGGPGVSRRQEDVSVTVTNVLLYNRPLNDDEITALNTKLSIPKAKDTKTVKEVTPPEVSKQASLEAEIPSSLDGQQQTEQGSLRTSENKGSGGLSTSAASSATSSPAAKETKDQSASGTYPEGHSKAGFGSSSEGVQTVDAETGDTVQGDGTQQPSVGTPAAADTNAPTAEIMAHDGAAVKPEAGASSGESGEPTEEADAQEEEVHPQDGEVNTTVLSSSLGNVSQGNNTDAGTVRGSGLLPSLLILLLGLWVFAAL